MYFPPLAFLSLFSISPECLSVAVTALLLLSGPGETQEESVWPRWLLPADTAKVNEQSALGLLEVCAAVVGGLSWKGIPLCVVDRYRTRSARCTWMHMFVQAVCECVCVYARTHQSRRLMMDSHQLSGGFYIGQK